MVKTRKSPSRLFVASRKELKIAKLEIDSLHKREKIPGNIWSYYES